MNIRRVTLTLFVVLAVLLLFFWPGSTSVAQDSVLSIGLLGTFPTQHVALDVYVQDNVAYVAADDLFIIDVRDPANPTLISQYDGIVYEARTKSDYETLTLGAAVQVFDNRAYIADGYGTLNVADLSDPANPEFVGAFPQSIQGIQVQVIENLAYVAGNGLMIFDTSDFTGYTYGSPVRQSFLGGFSEACFSESNGAVSGFLTDFQVVDTLAYATSEDCRVLLVIDISDPRSTRVVGSYDVMGDPVNLEVVDNLVYIAAKSGGLRIVDVSDPANPTLHSSYETAGDAQDVQIVDGLAYVLNRARLVEVLDVSDPATPVLYAVSDEELALARTFGAFAGNAIYVSDGLIYVADLRGLSIFSLDRDSPGTVPSFDAEEVPFSEVLLPDEPSDEAIASLLTFLIIAVIILAIILLVIGFLAFLLFRVPVFGLIGGLFSRIFGGKLFRRYLREISGGLPYRGYYPAPNKIPGIKGLRPARPKTPKKGGTGLRKRWKDKKGRIYEWDYQHGRVEMWDKTGKHHLGEYDPYTGERLKGPQDYPPIEP